MTATAPTHFVQLVRYSSWMSGLSYMKRIWQMEKDTGWGYQ